jgi:8-oxo-dGTP pyrophosphatase MutT (NUDIX family)
MRTVEQQILDTIGHRSTKHVSHGEERCPHAADARITGQLMTHELSLFFNKDEFFSWFHEYLKSNPNFNEEIEHYLQAASKTVQPSHVDPLLENNFQIPVTNNSEATIAQIESHYAEESAVRSLLAVLRFYQNSQNIPTHEAARLVLTVLERAYPALTASYKSYMNSGHNSTEAVRLAFADFSAFAHAHNPNTRIKMSDEAQIESIEISRHEKEGLVLFAKLQERLFSALEIEFANKLLIENTHLKHAIMVLHKKILDFAVYRMKSQGHRPQSLIPFDEIFLHQNGEFLPNNRLIKILCNNWIPAIAREMLQADIYDPQKLEGQHIQAAIEHVTKTYRQLQLVIFMFNQSEDGKLLYNGNLHRVCPARTAITFIGDTAMATIYEQLKQRPIDGEPVDERSFILAKLQSYTAATPEEEAMRQEAIEFITNNPDCFKRTLLTGHVNGSAWVVNPEMTHVLMTHHAKHNRWLQFGGHSDGDPNTLQVAIRETREESGLYEVTPLSEEIFDIDNHGIPEKGAEPAHIHYDIRFILKADMQHTVTVTNESKDVQWVPLEEVTKLNGSDAISRMVEKTIRLRASTEHV